MNLIQSLSANASSWSDLHKHIADLSSEHDKGNAFENFAKALLALDPRYQYKAVYLRREIPSSIRERLALSGIQDNGIDGVAVTVDDALHPFQCKFRSDSNDTPTYSELATFLATSERADSRLIITNTTNVTAKIQNQRNVSCIIANSLDRLDSDFFDRLRSYLDDNAIKQPSQLSPNSTQQEAIDAALPYFMTHDRGQLILPCGTGKTLASLWIAERLQAKSILIMVPSLALMAQTLRQWAVNTSLNPFRYLCLCSDTTVDLGNDSPIEHISDVDFPVTTDIEQVKAFLQQKPDITSIVFATYQSSKALSLAALEAGMTFDLAIFDEAHRTAGIHTKTWGIALSDANVPIKKRLFMTATPKVYAPNLKAKATIENIPLCSMDDEVIYGKPFFEMTYAEAIARGHISDYKVIVTLVSDAEVKTMIEARQLIVTTDDQQWDANALAKRVALAKGLSQYDLKKGFTFHSNVKGAAALTDAGSPHSLNAVYNRLHSDAIPPDRMMQFFHVNGAMSSGCRSSIMHEFETAECGIVSNARCLVEGVDVPSVDYVAFMDPKRSPIDIIQAAGRALRGGKALGYIFVPVVLNDSTDPAEALAQSDFAHVWQVLQAMVDQDQRLELVVSDLAVLKGQGAQGTPAWTAAMQALAARIEFFNIPARIDEARFIDAISTKAIDVLSKTWDYWYGLTLKYKDMSGNANAEQRFVMPGGDSLGAWQNQMRVKRRNGQLSQDRIARLDAIGFIWDFLDAQWEQGFQETVRYIAENNQIPNTPKRYKTPAGYRLGLWQSNQKRARKQGALSQDRIARLTSIGFAWDALDAQWQQGLQETIRYAAENNQNPNTPKRYKTAAGYRLGLWQSNQKRAYKRGVLNSDRIALLSAIGFLWDMLDARWESGLQETVHYAGGNDGKPNAPASYISPGGFKLGLWQSNKRREYKNGLLSRERIAQLDAIGFRWDVLDDLWEQGYRETLRYAKGNDWNLNTPVNYITSEGFQLGTWQSNQRSKYKSDNLSPVRVKKLTDIGFKWELQEDVFPIRWAELRKFQAETGHVKVPRNTQLGSWLHEQRKKHKKNKLNPEHAAKLSALGIIGSSR
ncbi:MAG TPA: Helicase associated domain protein [Dissulfurispiraceae bacterium]|nr:Helicase associated domain protein [Dissulfurispiraceae bacterium]